MAYHWDKQKRRYVDDSGLVVAEKEIRKGVEEFAAALLLYFLLRSRKILEILATVDQTPAGAANFHDELSRWYLELQNDIRASHIAIGILVFGGFQNASSQEMDQAESFARVQLQFFLNFAAGVFSGAVALNGRFVTRTGLYANAVFATYQNMIRVREHQKGATQEKRNLNPAEHCQTCLDQAALGWQSPGILKAIGDSECLVNCRCYFSFKYD